MDPQTDIDAENFEIANRWCESKGDGWSVRSQSGRGGTAPVFLVDSPDGERALKIYDAAFSSGEKGEIEEKRVEQQVALGVHDCPYLIKVYEGGRFEDRLFLLMNVAPGRELVTCLNDVPREKIRAVVSQIAEACIFLRRKELCHRDIKSENIFISDDFNIATLLDVSVTRDIHDPIGLGTDHDGQLPVVATARYCPPEYLFRLLEPGPELWHAVDIYQLGGLLHDLIMKKALFQDEYQKSKENRYRFAWVVATINPEVAAADVDNDLVLTAQRALDKDWKRRSLILLEDFLADTPTQQARALDALGLSGNSISKPHQTNVAGTLRRVTDVASELDAQITEHLRSIGATAYHLVEPGEDDHSKCLRFTWNARSTGADPMFGQIKLKIRLAFRESVAHQVFECSAELEAEVGDSARRASMNFPDTEDNEATIERLSEQVKSALGSLAATVVQESSGD